VACIKSRRSITAVNESVDKAQCHLLYYQHGSHSLSTPLAYSDRARSARQQRPIREPLGSNNHVVVITKPHSSLGPRIKMLLRGNGTTNSLLRPYRPELRKRARTFNRRLVDALAGEEAIRAFVRSEVAFGCPWLVRCKNVIRLDNVELDQRIASPAIEGDPAGSFGRVCARVLDCSGRCQQPISIHLIFFDVASCQSHREPPGLNPVPATKPPPGWPDQLHVYLPPPKLLQLKLPLPSDQNE
jgi:hypothetical protein